MSRTQLSRAVQGALFYTAVGPPIGLIVLLLFLIVTEFVQDPGGQAAGDLGSLLLGAPILVAFSYILGVVPGFLTGFIAGLFLRRLASLWHVLLIGVVGACVGGGCALPFMLDRTTSTTDTGFWRSLSNLWLLAGPSFVAALFCAWRQLRGARTESQSRE